MTGRRLPATIPASAAAASVPVAGGGLRKAQGRLEGRSDLLRPEREVAERHGQGHRPRVEDEDRSTGPGRLAHGQGRHGGLVDRVGAQDDDEVGPGQVRQGEGGLPAYPGYGGGHARGFPRVPEEGRALPPPGLAGGLQRTLAFQAAPKGAHNGDGAAAVGLPDAIQAFSGLGQSGSHGGRLSVDPGLPGPVG